MHARPLHALVVAISFALGLSACRRAPTERAIIVGRLLDGFDHPIVGATATIENSGYAATTNARGEFSLDYAPGAFAVRLGARNCVRQDIPLTISAPVRYVLGMRKLLCVPDLSQGQVVVQAHDRFYALPRTTLAVRQVTQPGRWGVQCTNTFIEMESLPTLTGNDLTSWLPPQTVESLADHNLVLARANGTQVDSQGITLGMGPACTGISNPTGERSRDIYAGWHPHRAEHLTAGLYCFLRGARYQMPIAQASEGYCFHWVPNANENLGPVVTEPSPDEYPTGQREGDDHSPNAGGAPVNCPEREGKIPCTEECYRANAMWSDPDDPPVWFGQQAADGHCYMP